MFFSANDGRYYPVSRIEMIGVAETDERHKGRWTHQVLLSGGEGVRVRDDEVQRILSCGTAIEASPGYSVVHVDAGEVFKAPVVGWIIGSGGTAAPLTPDGMNDGVDTVVSILTPDGQVIRPGDRAWDNLEAFVSDQSRPGFDSE